MAPWTDEMVGFIRLGTWFSAAVSLKSNILHIQRQIQVLASLEILTYDAKDSMDEFREAWFGHTDAFRRASATARQKANVAPAKDLSHSEGTFWTQPLGVINMALNRAVPADIRSSAFTSGAPSE
jgi:hypothetical protein